MRRFNDKAAVLFFLLVLGLMLMAVLIRIPRAAANTIIGFNSPYDIAISPNYNYFYVTNNGSNTVSIVDPTTNTIVGTINGFNRPVGISITPNGTFAYVANFGNNELIRIKTATNTINGIIGGFDQPYFVSISPDGKTAYVTNQGNNTVSIVDLVQPATSTTTTSTPTTSIATSTTIPGGGGGSTGGGGGGVGGQSLPITVKVNNSCYIVTNIAQLNSFNISVGRSNLKITDNYINPNGAGILVNGTAYVLALNTTYNISNSTATVRLANVSYLPIQHTITLQLCSIQPLVAQQFVALTYKPIYATAQPNDDILSQLDLQNIGIQPQSISLSVMTYQNLLALSTNRTYLYANQNASIELTFQSQQNATPGTYNIPIDVISNTANGLKSELTTYVTFVIQNKTVNKPSYSSQIDILNYTLNYSNIASGIIKINSPGNSSLSNISLRTTMPLSVANSISQIVAYGLNNNKTIENGNYIINWYISYIPSGQSIYAYYTINKPSNQSSLKHIQDEFVPLPPNQKQSILRLVNIVIPTFYTDSTNHMSIYVLYKGVVTQRVLFSLMAPSGTTIYNGTQIVNASPNQILNRSFVIATGNTLGTLILNLSVSTAGGNLTYTLPINILPSTTSTSTIPQKQINHTPNEIETIGIILIIIALALILLYALKKRSGSEHKSDAETAKGNKEDMCENCGGTGIDPPTGKACKYCKGTGFDKNGNYLKELAKASKLERQKNAK